MDTPTTASTNTTTAEDKANAQAAKMGAAQEDSAKKSAAQKSTLLASLQLFVTLYHKPISMEALISGLPITSLSSSAELLANKSGLTLFARVAQKAGFKSSLFERPIEQLLQLQLPAILLLSHNNSCILDSFSKDRKKVKIIHPGDQYLEQWLDISELEESYLGYALLLKKTQHYDSETPELGHQQHWFWHTLARSKKLYLDVILASFLINLFILATPLFTMNVYDRVIPNDAIETLMVFTLGVVAVYLLDVFLKLVRSYFLEIAAKKSDVIMSSIIFEKVMDMKMSVFPNSVGSFASNIKDFDSIRNFLTNATLVALIDLPFALLFFGVIYWIAGSIVIIPMISACLILLFALVIRKPLRRSIESTYEASAWKNGVLIESLQNIETIKSHGLSAQAQWQWEESTGNIAQKSLRSRLLSSSLPTITGFLTQLNTVLVVFYGVYLIKDLDLTMGGLIAVVILTSRTIAPMGQAAGLISNYEDAKTAFTMLDNIMQLPDEHPKQKRFVNPPEFKGKIEFKQVSFSYPDNDKPAISNLSFVIEAGEKVGFIGRMGSGKSTIEKLILGIYQAQSGSILIDNIDINQIDPNDLRHNISYVPQDIHLFKGTVRDNILKGRNNCDDTALLKAAKISGAQEFINQHPCGFDMRIGERGLGLSGGQKQSIAIARALLKQGIFKLYDEPSNAMDQLSESRLLNALKEEFSQGTLLLITQKTAPLQLVDRLIVMEQGSKLLDGNVKTILKQLAGESNDKNR